MHIGPAIIFDFRRTAVIARLGSSGLPNRVALRLAQVAAWCAIGSLAAVLALPVLTLLSMAF